MLFKLFTNIATLALFVILIPQFGHGQCSSIIDLNTWSQEGPAASGTWTVNAAGTEVIQSINGYPTFFVSPQSFINVRMTGTISTTGGDDDFIGFVYGYRSPIGPGPGPNYNIDTYLFDWKQGTQTVGAYTVQQGSYLTAINGSINLSTHNQYFWGHQNGPPWTQIGSNTGAGTGWNQGTVYNFELTYLATRTIISINGDTLFDVPGCFEPGRFGFYNYSQNPVIYSNFQYQLLPNFAMGSNNICLSDSAEFFYSVDTCSSASNTNSIIANWDWDFGDGNNSNLTNPNHLYQTTGTYNVELIITDSIGCQDSLSQTIVVTANPGTPSASNNSPFCEGGSLNLTGSPTGGLNYVWTGPNAFGSNQQNPSISPTVAADSGNYVLVVNNGICFSEPDTTLAVIYPTPAAPTAGSNAPICADSLLNLTASTQSGASYTWTGPNGFSSSLQNPSISNPATNASGVYSVTSTINGCTGPAGTVAVTVNPTPVVNITGDSSICIGDSTILTTSGANTYLWSTNSTNNSITVGPGLNTTYLVTGTSVDGCPSLPDSIEVVVNPLPVVNLGADTTVCDSLVLDAGPGFLNYAWNTGASSQSITVSITGTWSVTVMNADSCLTADSILVTVDITPGVNITGTDSICLGGSSTLNANASGGIIAWSTGASTNAITVTPTADSTFYVQATNNACASPLDSFEVIVSTLPLVNLGADTTVCDSMLLAGPTGMSTYLWNTGATSSSISILNSGIYSLTVTNANSCIAEDSIDITVNNTQAINIGPDQSICQGSNALFQAIPSNFPSYLWSTLATTSSISPGTAGTYFCDALDGNGCPSSDTAVLSIFPVLSGDIGNDTLICDGASLILDAGSWAGTTYLWTPGGSANSSIVASTAGLYTVEIDDGNGCLYRDSLNLSIDTPPAIVLSVSVDTACLGDQLVFSVAPGNLDQYDFFDGVNLVLSGPSSTLTTSSLAAGHSISAIGQTVNGCLTSSSNSISVELLARPSGTVVVTTVCEGEVTDFSLTASGASSMLWSGSGGLSGSGLSLSHTYASAGTYPWSVVLDNGFCDTTISGTVLVMPRPAAALAPSVSLCEGEFVSLTAGGQGTLNWYDEPVNGNLIGVGPVCNPPVTSSDSFYVQCDLNGCLSPFTLIPLTINPNPIADFLTSPDSSLELNLPQANLNLVNLSTGADSYIWDFGDGNTSSLTDPEHLYQEEGFYVVQLISSTLAGCHDTLSRGIFEVIDEHHVFIPSGFSPNGDGLNDLFIPVGFGIESYEVNVFDRWGKLVFHSNNGTVWDGTFKSQPLPEGVYVYKIRAFSGSGEVYDYQGTITLLR